MKESGKTIKKKEKAFSFTPMVTDMKATFKTIIRMEKELNFT